MKPNPHSLLPALVLGAACLFGSGASSPAATSYPATVLSQQPIAYWRFNDGGQTPGFDTAGDL
ncbi:MAG TPA: hypothetical protein DCM86_06240, partial [Verrucomicrobiales bacterium]|nr:hypothetical protein [Verrucomicrobiales bacterium]